MPTRPRLSSLAPSGLDRGAPDTGPRQAGAQATGARRLGVARAAGVRADTGVRPWSSPLIRGARRQPPAVEADPAGRPLRVRLGRTWLPIRHIQEAWVVEGRWWAVEERRHYLRVEAGHAVVELVRRDREPWSVARVLD